MMYNDEIHYVGIGGVICLTNCRVKRIVKVKDDWNIYDVVFDLKHGDGIVTISEPGTGVILDNKVKAFIDNSGVLDLSKIKLCLYNREMSEVLDTL